MRTLKFTSSVVSLLLMPGLCAGCNGSREADQVVREQSEYMLEKGQNLEAALKRLRSLGLDPVVWEAAVAHADNEPQTTLLVGNLGDALFIEAIRAQPNRPALVREIYWYRNWEEESARPRSQRQRAIEPLESINVTKLLQEQGRPRPAQPDSPEAQCDPFANSEP